MKTLPIIGTLVEHTSEFNDPTGIGEVIGHGHITRTEWVTSEITVEPTVIVQWFDARNVGCTHPDNIEPALV